MLGTEGDVVIVPAQRGAAECPRWSAALPHRQRLVALLRCRGHSHEDAEDIAHDAMLRVVNFPDADPERLGPLLTTVTLRLGVDQHRRATRAGRLADHRALIPRPTPSPEEEVCDRAEAAWLSEQTHRLTARDRAALVARADGQSSSQVAEALQMTPRAAECASSRARHQLRAILRHT